MSRIFITGDTHGDVSRLKFIKAKIGAEEYSKMTREDVVIIAGDFGLLWDGIPSKEELWWLKWVGKKPWTTLFIDGNHENFERLDLLPSVAKYGGTVGQVTEAVYHLRRGEIYTINDKTFFCFGGADSVDKEIRIPNVSWWAREVANYAEMEHGLAKLDHYNNSVDYILTHTMPEAAIDEWNAESKNADRWKDHSDPTAKYLTEIDRLVTRKNWFCGHFHANQTFLNGSIQTLYGKIIEV